MRAVRDPALWIRSVGANGRGCAASASRATCSRAKARAMFAARIRPVPLERSDIHGSVLRLSRHLYAPNTHYRHRRNVDPARRCARQDFIAHQTEAAACATEGAPASSTAGLFPFRHRPTDWLRVARRAHARSAEPGLSGTRSAVGHPEQPSLRSVRPRASGQVHRRALRARSATTSRPRLRDSLVHRRSRCRP